MDLCINIKGKSQIELFSLIMSLGLLVGLKNNALLISDAYEYLYNPYFAGLMEEKGFSDDLVNMLYHTCELENIQRILPEKITLSYEDIQRQIIDLLKKGDKESISFEYEIKD